MLLKIITKYGRVKSVILITLSAVVASVIVTFSIFIFSKQNMPLINIYMAILIPAVLASLWSWRTVGMIIKIHELEQEVRKLADYDSLTSVMSRVAFLNMSETIYQLMLRNNSVFSILYIDIDDFKKINDTYTHAAGDIVLENFGSILLKNSRKSDIAGRLGGEEFALLLADTDSDGAVCFAEKIRNCVKKSILTYMDKNIGYTVSIGISVFDKTNRVILEKLIAQADTALYKAKNSGKDCVVNFKNI